MKGHYTAPNGGCAETFRRCNRCQVLSNQRVFKSLNEKLCEHTDERQSTLQWKRQNASDIFGWVSWQKRAPADGDYTEVLVVYCEESADLQTLCALYAGNVKSTLVFRCWDSSNLLLFVRLWPTWFCVSALPGLGQSSHHLMLGKFTGEIFSLLFQYHTKTKIPHFIAFENLGRNDLDFPGNADVLFWKQSSFDLSRCCFESWQSNHSNGLELTSPRDISEIKGLELPTVLKCAN